MSGREQPAFIRGVLFDKDGTLLDYDATWVPINREIALFAASGDPLLAAELLQLGGQDPIRDVVASGSPFAVGSVEEIAEVFARHLGSRAPRNLLGEIDRLFQEGGAEHAVLLDGVCETIGGLKARGLILGVASNDTIGGIEASLGRHGLLDVFDFLAGCDSGHGAKPGPGMGAAFAASTGLDPAVCAIVGDAVHDMEMGRRAGFGARVAVTTGTSGAAELEPHCDLLLDRLDALLSWPRLGRARA